MKKKYTFLIAAIAAIMLITQPRMAVGQQVTYDFTTTNNFYTDSNLTTHPSTGNTNTLNAFYYTGGSEFNAGGKGYFNSGYFMLGKKDATLQLPTFSFNVKKIVVVGNSGASDSTGQNIYVGSTAVSTATTGSTGTNTYVINSSYQASGTTYLLKVTTAHNAQITSIQIYRAYNVSYNAGTGSGTMTDNNTYAQGDEVSLLANSFTAPANYTFSSWLVKDADNNTITVTNNKFTMPASNVTVTAQWVSSGPTQLATPTNFSATPGNAQASFSWDAVANASSYTISYTPEGGAEQTVSGITGTSRTITGLTNDKAYTCKIKAVGDGTNYSDSEYSSTISVTPTGATFYTVTIADGIENGTVEASPTSATQGTQISLTANPSAGCGFTSWNVYKTGDQTTTVTITDNKFNMPEYNVTVSATFTPYSVTLNAGTGSVASPTWNVTLNEGNLPAASPSATCTEDGWTFYGWSTAAVSETTTAPTTMVQTAYVPTGNTTLYAVYKEGQAAFDNTASGNWTIYATVSSTNYYATEVSNNKLQSSSTASDATEFNFVRNQNTGKYAIKVGSKYLYHSGDNTNIGLRDDEYEWSISSVSSNGSWRLTSTTTDRGLIYQHYTKSGQTTTYTRVFGGYKTTNVDGDDYFDVEIGVKTPATYNSNPLCLEKVATPNITLAAGTYTEVKTTTITCDTDQATIYYTTDGTVPSSTNGEEYTAAITIDESMTIKAIAVKDGMADSEIASKSYVINLPLTTMDAVFAKATQIGSSATQDVTVVFNNWVVSAVNGSSAYVTDNAGKGFIIYTSDHGFAVGDKLSGTVSGTPLKLYNGAAEFTNIKKADISSVTGEQTVAVVTKTISELSGVNTGAIITVNNVRYDGSTYLEDPDDSSVKIKPYNGLGYSASFTEDHNYNVTGMYLQFNTTKELCSRAEADIVEVEYAINGLGLVTGGTIGAQNSSSVSITTAKYEEEVTLVATPAEHYVLTEWTVMNGQESVTVNNNKFTMPKGAVTVTATFALKYTVTYHANGGTGDDVVQVYDNGDPVTVAAANLFEAPDCSGFSVWNTQASGHGSFYDPDDKFNIGSNIDLYAQWEAIGPFTITYGVNGNTTVIAAETVDCGETVTLPAASLEPLTFLYWENNDGDKIGEAGEDYEPTADVTLYAVFGSMGEDYLTITTTTTGITDAYKDNSTFEINDIDFTCNDICKQGPTDSKYIQMKSTGYIYNDNNNSFGKITSIVITYYDATTSAIVKFGTSYNPTSSDAVSGVANDYVLTYTPDSENDYGYFRVGASETVHMLSIVINYEATAPVTITNVTGTETIASIATGGCIVVHNNGVLTFTGSNNDASKLIVQDGGQLKVTSTGSKADVKATVQKEITGYGTGISDKWNFIASPITTSISPAAVTNLLGEQIDDDPVTYNYDLYRLNNTTWENYHQHNENADPFMLVNGQGYLYAKQTNTTLSFAGTIKPYDDNYEISVSKGWNLVGNPYTFDAYFSEPYYAMEADGTGITAYDPTSVNTPVKPCTGIVIYADNDNPDPVAFSDQGPVTSVNHGNLQMVLSHNVASRGNNAETIGNAIVSFNEGTKLQKFYFGEPAANIFIPQDNEEYAIVSTEARGEMPVNFKAAKDGQYTISVNAEDVEMSYLHLIDNITGADVDLLNNPSYTFTGSTLDYASRFRLVFSANNNDETNAEMGDDFAFISNGQIILNGTVENATLQMIDMLGRVVSSQQINGNSAHMAPVTNGVYVLRLINNGESKTQKVVVK